MAIGRKSAGRDAEPSVGAMKSNVAGERRHGGGVRGGWDGRGAARFGKCEIDSWKVCIALGAERTQIGQSQLKCGDGGARPLPLSKIGASTSIGAGSGKAEGGGSHGGSGGTVASGGWGGSEDAGSIECRTASGMSRGIGADASEGMGSGACVDCASSFPGGGGREDGDCRLSVVQNGSGRVVGRVVVEAAAHGFVSRVGVGADWSRRGRMMRAVSEGVGEAAFGRFGGAAGGTSKGVNSMGPGRAGFSCEPVKGPA